MRQGWLRFQLLTHGRQGDLRKEYDSVRVSDEFCVDQKTAFGDNNAFIDLGRHKVMGDSFENGMVLALSIGLTTLRTCSSSDHPSDHSADVPGNSR